MNAEPILQISHLSKSFGGVQAVRDCTFDVLQGSITGLIGPNGAGKSTTVNLISGFHRPDSGEVRFEGRAISGRAPHRIAARGLIRTFQTAREWESMSVMENMLVAAPAMGRDAAWRSLVMPGRISGAERADRVRAREILSDLALLQLRNQPAGELSGGQKRLLEFARIIMARPRMVLLDEPLSGVNPLLITRIADAIAHLRESGITVLIVEHNLTFVEHTCETAIVMALGTAIASGPMEALRKDEAVLDAYLGVVTGG
jgi:ABC-type branched-subunit amino acid transport system ATPase component